MNSRPEIQQVVDRFITAYNTNDANVAPLSEDVLYRGPMVPEPLCGRGEVRQYMAEITPFVARMELKQLIVEGDAAAAVFTYEGVNGVVIEGAEFFRIRDGQISDMQVFFDTRTLVRGEV